VIHYLSIISKPSAARNLAVLLSIFMISLWPLNDDALGVEEKIRLLELNSLPTWPH
jgi:hypothetical protein